MEDGGFPYLLIREFPHRDLSLMEYTCDQVPGGKSGDAILKVTGPVAIQVPIF
jgi:hypothetical protein